MDLSIAALLAQDGISEKLFPGNSIQQLTALVDLLMNFDVYAKSKTSVTPLVKAAAAASPPPAGGAEGSQAPPNTGAGGAESTNPTTNDQTDNAKPADDAAA